MIPRLPDVKPPCLTRRAFWPGVFFWRPDSLRLKRSFAQFSAASKTLTGGTYDLEGTLKFVGADIHTNAAAVLLDGPSSAIVSDTGANGLAGFATNSAAADSLFYRLKR